jgi:hypothetical protein
VALGREGSRVAVHGERGRPLGGADSHLPDPAGAPRPPSAAGVGKRIGMATVGGEARGRASQTTLESPSGAEPPEGAKVRKPPGDRNSGVVGEAGPPLLRSQVAREASRAEAVRRWRGFASPAQLPEI